MVQAARGYPCITELAAGFGGGIGRKQDVCGAIAGGVIAIGYRAAEGQTEQRQIAAAARQPVADLYDGFRDRFGAVDCRALIDYDYSDPAQYEKAHNDPERKAKCNAYKEYVIHRLLFGE